jgi:hypothetical protein
MATCLGFDGLFSSVMFAEASVATAAFGSCLWLAHSAISEVTVAPQPPLADIQRYVAVNRATAWIETT